MFATRSSMLWICLLALVLQSSCLRNRRALGSPCESGIRLATWNIQNYGVSKSKRPAVMRALAQTIVQYDMVVIQELSQMPRGSGVCGPHTMSAICKLLSYVNEASSRNFALTVSPRIGDEQNALIYDPLLVSVVGGGEYPDTAGKHSRPPYTFMTESGGKSMAIASVHVRPDEAVREIGDFPSVVQWMEQKFAADYNMIVGDYNADGSYFNEDSGWPPVLSRVPNYCMATGNELDTTVATSSNTYDRMLVSSGLELGQASVFMPEQHLNLTDVLTEGCAMGYVPSSVCQSVNWVKVMAELSDHYPVEACINLDQSSGPAPCPPPAEVVPSPAPQPPAPPVQAPAPPSVGPAALSPGDCAIVGFVSDNPDDFGAVLLAPVGAGEKISMTDSGVNSDGSLRGGEGIRSFVAAEPLTVGTVLRMADFSIAEQGSVALSASSDQVVVFVGDITAPTYVCALTTAAAWQSTATSTATSALPLGLVDGVSAMSGQGRHTDNGAYVGPTRGSLAALRAAINDVGNWARSNSARPPIPQAFQVA